MRCAIVVPLCATVLYLLLCALRYHLDPETPLSTTFPSADLVVEAALTRGAVVKGRRVVVTGSNTGIGFDCARVLGKYGARVVASARSVNKGAEAVRKMNKRNEKFRGAEKVMFAQLDLSSFASIEAFAAQLEEPVDVLILNAAVIVFNYAETEEGIELLWGVNHIGHFYLVELLGRNGKLKPQTVVVVVSSIGHRTFMTTGEFDKTRYPLNASTFNFVEAYGVSKLANNLHALALSRGAGKRLPELFAFAVHPGMVRTEFGKLRGCESMDALLYRVACELNILSQKLWWTVLPFTLSTSEGAANVLFPLLMSAADMERYNGGYFANKRRIPASPIAEDLAFADTFYEDTRIFVNDILRTRGKEVLT